MESDININKENYSPILCIIRDIIFQAKVKEFFKNHNKTILFINNFQKTEENIESIFSSKLLIADLNTPNLIPIFDQIKEYNKDIQSVAFFSHVDIEKKNEAIEKGFDLVIPRSKFFEDIGQFLE